MIHNAPTTTATVQDYIIPLVYGLLFVGSVYLQTFIRKRSDVEWLKQNKQISRIIVVSGLTFLLMLYDYSEKCQPYDIGAMDCFYINFDYMQCVHILMANTLLFAYHIYEMTSQQAYNSLKTDTLRKIIFAPILQQLLFRAVFYRSGRGAVSIVYLSALFSIAHFHKHIQKIIAGENRRIAAAVFQLFFTFIFSLYSYYFLYLYQSIIPCILLHSYCNFLGPPKIKGKKSLIFHSICVICFSLYLIYVA